MAVAYIILAHHKPEQVARLVGRLSSSTDVVYVHVDRKSDLASFQEAFAKLPRPPVVLRRRVRVYWASYSHIKATMLGIRAALRSERRFSHLVLLTGQDYPIRSTAEIQSFFAGAKGHSYISWSAGAGREVHDSERRGNAVWLWSGEMWPLNWWHVSLGDRWWHLQPRVRRRIPRGLTPHQGLAYWSITPEAAAYCLRSTRRRPTLRWFFNFVFIPDENLFQMLLLASPLRDTLVNEDLRHMNWDGYHPKTLRMHDLDSMRASDKLFARKFDIDVDAAVLDELDRGSTSSLPLPAGSTPEDGRVVGAPGGHGGT